MKTRDEIIEHEIYYDVQLSKPVTDYDINVDGAPILNKGIFYVFGKSQVVAQDNAIIYAYEDCTVRAHNSTVYAFEDSTVRAFDNSKVNAYFDSLVFASGNSIVNLYESSTVWAYGDSKIIDKR